MTFSGLRSVVRHFLDSLTGRKADFPTAVSPSVAMTKAGLVLGHDSVLVRITENADGRSQLDLNADRDRFIALLSIVGDRPVATDAFRHIEAAHRFWQRGDKALANLRLIFADLPRLAALSDAYRLTLAVHLLDEGMAPDALTKELGLELATRAIKYAPNQARIPAGHGRESGQFTFGHEAAAASDARIVLASEDENPSKDKEYFEHQGESAPTPSKEPRHDLPLLMPGPPPPISSEA